MRRALLIGIGAGGLDQLTVEAVAAINDADVFLVAAKNRGVDDLETLRKAILRRHRAATDYRVIKVPDPERDRDPTDYGAAVRDWHEARAAAYESVIAAEVPEGGTCAFLVWGDPSLYDSTIRVVERIRTRGNLELEYEVLPGVSSVQLLAARHRLVLNRIGGPITITTGRGLARDVAAGADNIVVMLDKDLAAAALPGDWDIYWGANLGTPDEELVAGRLSKVLEDIHAARERAASARGWVMDTYLIRRA
ncbi:precorrin-6A synthase (deacetylating) [Tomitella biformata]|uniref:precorrin-6A synthase (deacetylating) n=1 Tax=Tomitella biformata TaxID=630403 RepID=UPI0004AD2FB4|nr:precorrin-6A synthase (deacetylating) [Tomitella biformata]